MINGFLVPMLVLALLFAAVFAKLALKGANPFRAMAMAMGLDGTSHFAAFRTAGESWGHSNAAEIALAAKIWSAVLYMHAIKETRLSKFIGTGEDAIIQLKNDFKKSRGDQITFGLRNPLPKTSNRTQDVLFLEGAETKPTYAYWQMGLWADGNAVSSFSRFDMQRPEVDVQTENQKALSDWIEEIDEEWMLALLSYRPTNYVDYTGSGKKFGTVCIEAMVDMANALYPKIRAVNVGGRKMYVILANTWQIRDLKSDVKYIRFLHSSIAPKMMDNPFFIDADCIYENCVIYRYDRIESEPSTGVARALLLGAQAGAIGYAMPWTWTQYKCDQRFPAVMTDVLYGMGKPQFKFDNAATARDYGVVAADTNTSPESLTPTKW